MRVEDGFAKLLGREPSADERERLRRVRDALQIADNDALWAVVVALEHYDALFREYPEKLAAATRQALEGVRAASAQAAKAEAAKVRRVLAEEVARAGRRLEAKAGRGALSGALSLPWMAGGLVALVAFGAECMTAGAELGGARRPFWAAPGPAEGARGVVDAVLRAPAGWMMLALLLPLAVAAAVAGWRAGTDGEGTSAERAWGWAVLALAALGGAAGAFGMATILG